MAWLRGGARAALAALFAAVALIGWFEWEISSSAAPAPVTERTSVWGNWSSTTFGPFDSGLSGTVTWTVDLSGIGNVTAEASSPSGTTSSFTIRQEEGARGPDVKRTESTVVPYTLTFTATNGSTSRTFEAKFTISPRPVSILGDFEVNDKTYDRNTAATLASANNTLSLQPYDSAADLLSGVIDNEVTLVPVSTFDSSAAGERTADLESSTLDGVEASNYVLRFAAAPTANGTINAKELDLVFDPVNKTYDGLRTVSVPTPTLSGVIDGDTVGVSGSPTWSFNNKNVGTSKPMTITAGSYALSGAAADNYSISAPSLVGEITTRTLAVNVNVTTKEYDGTNTATITWASDNRIAGDSLTVTIAPGVFAQTTPGSGISVTAGAVTLSGTDRNNYTVSLPASITGQISQRTLTIGGTFTVITRDYDKTTTATANTGDLTLVGVVGSESVSIDALTLSYASSQAGSHTVSITSATLTGANVTNYTVSLSGAPTALGVIQPLTMTVTATNTNKVYDGTTAATPTLTIKTLPGDTATVTGTATYAGANVGEGIGLNISGVVVGNPNYAVADTLATTGNITPKELTISGLTGVDRTYDATTVATVSGTASLVGIVPADGGESPRVLLDPAATPSYTFPDKNVGVDRPITATGFSLTGDAVSNYTLTPPTNLVADITPLAITPTVTANDKVYDATAAATATVSVAGVTLEGDSLTVAFVSATFSDRHVSGTDVPLPKTVTISGISLGGTDAPNYSTAETATTTATITRRTLTISSPSRQYNGSTGGTISFSTNRLANYDNPDQSAWDDVYVQVEGTFDSAAVGTHGVSFVISDSDVKGTDRNNYTWTLPTPTTGTITVKTLYIADLVANDKVYDATTSATVTGTPRLVGVVSGENVTLSGGGQYVFAQSSVGEAIRITVASGNLFVIGGEDAAKYSLRQPDFLADITPRELTIGGSFTAKDKEYNRTAVASFATGGDATLTLVGKQGSDSLSLSAVTLRFNNELAATGKTVSISAATFSATPSSIASNYTLSLNGAPTATAAITPKPLTVSATAISRTYDGTTTATLSPGPTYSGRVTGDTAAQVVLTASSVTFDNKNVGTGKTVTIALALSGTRASNYSVPATITKTANVTAKAITIDPTSVTGVNKTYDKTEAASVTIADGGLKLLGVIAGDTVEIVDQARTHTFADALVGTEKTITALGYALAPTGDGGNYSLSQPNFLKASITAKTVTASVSATSREYNGTTSVSSTLSLAGVISGDAVGVSGSVSFADKNVGTGKTVTASSLALTGTDSLNYSLNGVTSVTTTANITPFRLTVTPTASNRTYDGTTAATVTCSANKFGSDSLSVDCSNATFDTKDVAGTGAVPSAKTVTITGVRLTGTDAGNYLLPLASDSISEKTTFETSATITRRALKATGFTPVSRDYDGTRSATFTTESLTLGPVIAGGVGIVSGDEGKVVFSNPAGEFDSKNAGTQSVRLQSWTLSGAESNNYTVDVSASLTQAVISPINLTVTMTAADKTYDGNPTANVTAQIDPSGLVGSDSLSNITVSKPTGTFSDKNVGLDKPVTVNPATVVFSGSLSGNYLPVFTNPTADIAARALVWTVSAADKIFDGNTDVTYTLTDNRVSDDEFTVNPGTGSFATASRGSGKTVTVTGISISGTDAGNYIAPSSATGTATISARTVTVTGTFTASPKVYDRTLVATGLDTSGLTFSGLVGSDATAAKVNTATAEFLTKTVGTGKTVVLKTLTLKDIVTSNYTIDLSGVTNYTSGVITPLSLTPTMTVQDRLWNGGTSATITSITVAGKITGDEVSVNTGVAVAQFRSATQGNGKTVDVTNIRLTGADAGNYILDLTETATGVYSGTTTASITGTPITISITASDKVYDGTRTATITVSDDAAVSDDVTVTVASVLFATRDVGTSIAVTATGFSLSGSDAAKYVIANLSATDTADITAKPLTLVATSKVYDGNPTAQVALSGVESGDTVTFTSSGATFSDKNVGTGKTVTATGLALSGTHAGNYSISSTTTTTASITPRTLVVTFTPNPPVSDVASNITVDRTDNRITDDVLTITITDASAVRRGNQLILVVTGITLGDTDSGNYVTQATYEVVLRTFPAPSTPSSSRPPATTPEVVTSPLAPTNPTTNTGQNSTRPGQQDTGGTTTGGTSTGGTGSSSSGTQSGNTPPSQGRTVDILPGWRPGSGPEATIDFGQGVLTREGQPRDLADRIVVQDPDVIRQNQFPGFAPNTTTQVEIMGARTITQLVVSPDNPLTPERLRDAFGQASQTLGTDGPRVIQVTNPDGYAVPTPEELDLLQDALAWLGLPEATSGPGLSGGRAVVEVVWQVEGYRPGSIVFLIATSDPSLMAWGIADDEGRATLQGTVLDTSLASGEHRFRLVGTAVVGQLTTESDGSAALGEDLNQYLTLFDEDTRISLALWGDNDKGADHVVVRYIDPQLADDTGLWWWLLIPGLAWLLLVLWRRRRGDWTTPTGRVGTATTGVVLATPAIIVGVVLSQTPLIPAGIALGAVVFLVAAFFPPGQLATRSSRHAIPAHP